MHLDDRRRALGRSAPCTWAAPAVSNAKVSSQASGDEQLPDAGRALGRGPRCTRARSSPSTQASPIRPPLDPSPAAPSGRSAQRRGHGCRGRRRTRTTAASPRQAGPGRRRRERVRPFAGRERPSRPASLIHSGAEGTRFSRASAAVTEKDGAPGGRRGSPHPGCRRAARARGVRARSGPRRHAARTHVPRPQPGRVGGARRRRVRRAPVGVPAARRGLGRHLRVGPGQDAAMVRRRGRTRASVADRPPGGRDETLAIGPRESAGHARPEPAAAQACGRVPAAPPRQSVAAPVGETASNRATHSTCAVCGNMSTGRTRSSR